MHIPQYKPNRRYAFNMAPMIDVVFLLIIFFLVSLHLRGQETHMEIDLSAAISGEEDTDQQTPRITVNVKPDGSIWLAGRVVPAEQLADRFSAVKEEEGEDLEVRIRGSREAPYSSVEPVMLACTKSGIWKVKYAVVEPEDAQ
ncbi:MAG: biopolymer transporter ExbD [Planctomycetota bacterium]